jgi:hypothetical protein
VLIILNKNGHLRQFRFAKQDSQLPIQTQYKYQGITIPSYGSRNTNRYQPIII